MRYQSVRPISRRLLAATFLLVAMVVAAACSTDEPENQVAPDRDGFVEGDFRDVPIIPRAVALGDPIERDGVVTGNYKVQNIGPAEVLDQYTSLLDDDGWTLVEGPARMGDDIHRGDWIKDGRRLEVVAQPVTSVPEYPDVTASEPFDEFPTQLNLILYPDTTDVSVNQPS